MRFKKRLCTKRHVHSFKFTEAGFKVDIKGGEFHRKSFEKRERERESQYESLVRVRQQMTFDLRF